MKSQNQEPSTRRTGLLRLKWMSAVFLAAALALGAQGCTKAPEKPPESPLKQAKKDSRLDEREEQEFQRRHLAPPPAYGNKVVMAENDRDKRANF